MFVLKSFPLVKRNINYQTPVKYFYNELALLELTSLTDLQNLYSPKIQWFDDTFAAAVSFKYFKLWPSGKTVDFHYKYIQKEKKDALLARYLLALGAELFKQADLVELFYLIHCRIFSENSAFADGLKLMHKVVLMGNEELLRNLLKAGLNLNVFSEKGDKFVPRRLD